MKYFLIICSFYLIHLIAKLIIVIIIIIVIVIIIILIFINLFIWMRALRINPWNPIQSGHQIFWWDISQIFQKILQNLYFQVSYIFLVEVNLISMYIRLFKKSYVMNVSIIVRPIILLNQSHYPLNLFPPHNPENHVKNLLIIMRSILWFIWANRFHN
jgi:hypothetical protein